ncbi:hypothetical protein QL285_019375 [Trifolium repens]|nr:hypothetical protein QL285_019375 [Trifolium repens]
MFTSSTFPTTTNFKSSCSYSHMTTWGSPVLYRASSPIAEETHCRARPNFTNPRPRTFSQRTISRQSVMSDIQNDEHVLSIEAPQLFSVNH